MGRLERRVFHDWRGTRQVSEPYDAHVPHPVTGWEPPVPDYVRAGLGAAEDRLRAMRAEPRWSDPHPLTDWVLRRYDGIASSGIEGIQTTLRSVALHGTRIRASHLTSAEAEAVEDTAGAWRQIREALDLAEAGGPMTADAICGLHQTLLRWTPQQMMAGRVRREQNWISDEGAVQSPNAAVYVPPPPDLVPGLLQDLTAHMSADHDEPLLAAAVAHAQFESIHPFDDGNGRTGRALIHWMMRRAGLTGRLPIPVSAALEARRPLYYRALSEHQHYLGAPDHPRRGGSLIAWATLFADAVQVGCDAATAVADLVDQEAERWAGLRLRSGSAAALALPVINACPVLTAPLLAERIGVSEPAARRGLVRLADHGVLAEADSPHNGRQFEAATVLNLVDRRHEWLDARWRERRPGDRPARARAAADPSPPCPPGQCPRVGPISRQQCRLREGHRGQHRY